MGDFGGVVNRLRVAIHVCDGVLPLNVSLWLVQVERTSGFGYPVVGKLPLNSRERRRDLPWLICSY